MRQLSPLRHVQPSLMLSFIPRTHMIERERTNSPTLSSILHVGTTHTFTIQQN